jgi:hypothetical protein
MDLLFELATWHALAKLRLHTESTLADLESSTSRLGTLLRRFVSITCEAFDTRQLPSEEAAQARRKARLFKGKQRKDSEDNRNPEKTPQNSKKKTFSLRTYKLHALGAYTKAIRMFGTTDNYTTQTVCVDIFTQQHLIVIYRENWSTAA